jgi:hypothetical protein
MTTPSMLPGVQKRYTIRAAAGQSGGIFERMPGSERLYDFQYICPADAAKSRPRSSSSEKLSEDDHSAIVDEGAGYWFNVSTFSPTRSHVIANGVDGHIWQRRTEDQDIIADKWSGPMSWDEEQIAASTQADSNARGHYAVGASPRTGDPDDLVSALSSASTALDDSTLSSRKLQRPPLPSPDKHGGGSQRAKVDSRSAPKRRKRRISKFTEHVDEQNGTSKASIELERSGELANGSAQFATTKGEKATRRFFGLSKREVWWK